MFFDSNQYKASILFLSGHCSFHNNISQGKNGYFNLEFEKGNEKLYYHEIAKLWFERAHQKINEYLLIAWSNCHR